MKDSMDIISEPEIEVKEENEGNDFNEIPQTKTYCLLCQEYGHAINDNCVVNPTCFSCGVKGHVRRDCYCLICQEPGHVINDGCVTCLGCGVNGHSRRDCPSLLDENSEIPELEILDDQNMEFPPSQDSINIIPKNDKKPAIEYERGRKRDSDRRLYNLYNPPEMINKIDAPCRNFFNKGCKFGIACRFKHDNERRKTEVESRSIERSRSRSRERRNVQQDDPVNESISIGDGSKRVSSVVASGSIEKSDPPRKGGKDYSSEEIQAIVREVLVDLVSPFVLSRKYKISAYCIKNWVKKTGQKLPTQYKQPAWYPGPPKFPLSIPPKNGDGERIYNQPGLPSEIEACVGANMALTDANAVKALDGLKAVPVDATTVKCYEQGGSGGNQEGLLSNQTNNGPNKRDPHECHMCNEILYSFRTLKNHMRFEHGMTKKQCRKFYNNSRISS